MAFLITPFWRLLLVRPMKAFLCFVLFAQSAFALIGENEKQIEARYGRPKRSRPAEGGRVDTYLAHGFTINVHFISGLSSSEWFEPLGKSPFTKKDVKRILELSAEKGQTWRSKRVHPNWTYWTRSGDKAVADQVVAVSAPRIVDVNGVGLTRR